VEQVYNPARLQDQCWNWRHQGLFTALVPTMGCLHEGHLSLVSWARQNADRVVVSLFVNPSQFAPNEDLDAYPRSLERDAELAAEHGADVLFVPDVEKMYLPGHATWVDVPELTANLCGASRPAHFRGVATVVAKLFMLAIPTLAVFGQKDYQQFLVIRQMTRDLNIPTRVVGRPTVREKDGLAMSSRNRNLTQEERAEATNIHKGLRLVQTLVDKGQHDAATLRARAMDFYREHLARGRLDYLELVDAETLQSVDKVNAPVLAATAVFYSRARLIDNILLDIHPAA
jgi:pantoate--beta-alanine ligase